MEQHDRLYRLAYKKYLNDDLEFARQLAIEAVEKARQSFEVQLVDHQSLHFNCRALTLLESIERRSLRPRAE
jgi:hypothetical protein